MTYEITQPGAESCDPELLLGAPKPQAPSQGFSQNKTKGGCWASPSSAQSSEPRAPPAAGGSGHWSRFHFQGQLSQKPVFTIKLQWATGASCATHAGPAGASRRSEPPPCLVPAWGPPESLQAARVRGGGRGLGPAVLPAGSALSSHPGSAPAHLPRDPLIPKGVHSGDCVCPVTNTVSTWHDPKWPRPVAQLSQRTQRSSAASSAAVLVTRGQDQACRARRGARVPAAKSGMKQVLAECLRGKGGGGRSSKGGQQTAALACLVLPLPLANGAAHRQT